LISLIATLTLMLFLLPEKYYLISALESTKGLGYWGRAFVVGFYILATVLVTVLVTRIASRSLKAVDSRSSATP
jgi:hypothetical protein